MTNFYQQQQQKLAEEPHTWLITGVAGFIGSNLLEKLLSLQQKVIGVDNFSTGKRENLTKVAACVPAPQYANFSFIEGDIRDLSICQRAVQQVDYVLHHAALGSVPRSINDPITSTECNVNGFLNMLVASRDAEVRNFVYASSSSVYGDRQELPSVEHNIGKPLSPYALTKLTDEHYARIFHECYGLNVIGLRYFNVFGYRQNPAGDYAAVIPKWLQQLADEQPVVINGDGSTSRDFCFIANAVQACILAAAATDSSAINKVYNVAVGETTSLYELFLLLKDSLTELMPHLHNVEPIYQQFRAGDVYKTLADITAARSLLGYEPEYTIKQGLQLLVRYLYSQQS